MTPSPAHPPSRRERYRSRVRGCLLGGAVGDALGAPVEFRALAQIRAAHGGAGVRRFLPAYGREGGAITDDTQLTLFTAEGLIRAARPAGSGCDAVPCVDRAYQRWLDTQTHPLPTGERDGWLQGETWLYARRAPGTTCLDALTLRRGGAEPGRAANTSMGCGGVMRVAPVGLLPSRSESEVFTIAERCAALTHGHPCGTLPAGAFAVIVHRLAHCDSIELAVAAAIAELARHPGHEETTLALLAGRKATAHPPSAEVVERLGGGWVGHEALAIAVYAALAHPGPDEVLDALALAVTHSGDSDSTGAICGNILGVLHGEAALPGELARAVEGRDTVLRIADDFARRFGAGSPPPPWEDPADRERYPAG
ncbi:ADP-ribosylglycohydrolase family protein [Allonocardiopsis opalescens]|uniref:ADP-ribosylglycohydrolase n=1 Tax=Allonocardiopsis opalescens TaxID=1144618 RepID=A0A2T0QE24_9ACTN|nr:ADP-ribosylglycohydrolase family protein [Allonocardiopsis opalescens]PRY02142.1 ADP-ribosylglycohydrolase [Allonocardiopsis opalescens]